MLVSRIQRPTEIMVEVISEGERERDTLVSPFLLYSFLSLPDGLIEPEVSRQESLKNVICRDRPLQYKAEQKKHGKCGPAW